MHPVLRCRQVGLQPWVATHGGELKVTHEQVCLQVCTGEMTGDVHALCSTPSGVPRAMRCILHSTSTQQTFIQGLLRASDKKQKTNAREMQNPDPQKPLRKSICKSSIADANLLGRSPGGHFPEQRGHASQVVVLCAGARGLFSEEYLIDLQLCDPAFFASPFGGNQQGDGDPRME